MKSCQSSARSLVHMTPLIKKYYIKANLEVHTINLVVGIFSNRKLLISQNAASVPTCNLLVTKAEKETYYTPHGAVDYFIRFVYGRSQSAACDCHKVRYLSDEAIGYMKMLERQHNKIHALRRKAVVDENEFNELLMV
jgi:hypothetical protein